MMRTRFLLIAGLLTLAAAPSGCIISSDDDSSDSTLLVVNDSDYVIEEIYLTEVDNPNWGPDLLGGDVLFPGEDFLIVDIECDYYDALLVDEDGVECELLDIDLCFDDADWVIRNNTCTIFQATPAEKAAMPKRTQADREFSPKDKGVAADQI
jgi:hypothetical protein